MPGAPSARPVRRRLKRGAIATSGRPGTARGGVSGAASGRRSRPGAGGAGRAPRRASPCERARHRRRPVPKCGEKSEAEPGGGWDREREEAMAACTPPSRRAPRDRRVRASPSGPAFRNAAPWEPGACERSRARFTCSAAQRPRLRASVTARHQKVGKVQKCAARRSCVSRELVGEWASNGRGHRGRGGCGTEPPCRMD